MSQSFTHGYAVVIGVGADLPVTIDDAQAVADLLRDPTRCAYPSDQVRLLTGEGARRHDILTALAWLAKQAEADPEATAIVYFSGHGMKTPGYYLMPFGYDEGKLSQVAISGSEFTDRLRAIQAKKLLVLLDCCHAGGQAEAKTSLGTKSPLPVSLADELKRSRGRVVIASSRKDEVSWTGTPYSVFTAALLEALAGYGAFEKDGYARVLDVAMWLGRKVPEKTKDRQHPIIKVSGLQDNFALAYYAAGGKSPKKLAWTATAATATIATVTTVTATTAQNVAQVTSWQRRLANRRRALRLIEDRMSEFIEYHEIPLQLVDNKDRTEEDIANLEEKLGVSPA